ncbi:MAG: hypothetical protein AAFN92_20100 [Bacteroidota bacterium]
MMTIKLLNTDRQPLANLSVFIKFLPPSAGWSKLALTDDTGKVTLFVREMQMGQVLVDGMIVYAGILAGQSTFYLSRPEISTKNILTTDRNMAVIRPAWPVEDCVA